MSERKFEKGQLGKYGFEEYGLEEKNEIGKLKHEKAVFIYINIFLSDKLLGPPFDLFGSEESCHSNFCLICVL